jgi:hypothetical protein
LAASPVVILSIIALYSMVYIVIDPANAMPGGAEDLGNAEDPGEAPNGVLDIVVSILEKVWGVVLLLFGAMVFNVPEAPVYIQAPVAIIIIGSLAWSIATLVRGT